MDACLETRSLAPSLSYNLRSAVHKVRICRTHLSEKLTGCLSSSGFTAISALALGRVQRLQQELDAVSGWALARPAVAFGIYLQLLP